MLRDNNTLSPRTDTTRGRVRSMRVCLQSAQTRSLKSARRDDAANVSVEGRHVRSTQQHMRIALNARWLKTPQFPM